MAIVYVVRIRTTRRQSTHAIGNLEVRLGQHNSHLSFSMKNRGPWDFVHHEDFPTLA